MIHQVILNYFAGDGVGNCLKSLSGLLDRLEYENDIWAVNTTEQDCGKVKIFSPILLKNMSEDDIIIYHFSTGCDLNDIISEFPCKKILLYQNVTPARFFKGICYDAYINCLIGEGDARETVGKYDFCITPSEYSKKELIRMGWNRNKIVVIPVFDVKDTQCAVNQNIVDKYSDSKSTIFLFTGRLVPNKKIEDILYCFEYYKKYCDTTAKLFLVGGVLFDNYYHSLTEYVSRKNIDDVFFTGRVSQEDLEAYYQIADFYISMSEHEGFCLPILEAMQKGVVVVAYKSTAVPDTMSGNGVLLTTKKPAKVCAKIMKLRSNKNEYESIIQKQKEHVKQFNLEKHSNDVCDVVKKVESIAPRKNDKQNPKLFTESELTEHIRCLVNNKKKHTLVFYGFGKFGKKIYSELNALYDEFELVLLDNGKQGTLFEEKSIYGEEECIEKYPDAMYIVTIQKKQISIIGRLLEKGILPEQILFFDGNNIIGGD